MNNIQPLEPALQGVSRVFAAPPSLIVTNAYGAASSPFAWVSRGIVREWTLMDLPPAALSTYLGMKARTFHDRARLASTPPGGWPAFLGSSRNTVQRARNILLKAGIIERVPEGWRLIDEDELLERARAAAEKDGRAEGRRGPWMSENAEPVRIELAMVHGLPPHLARLLLTLWTFTKSGTDEAWPGINRLARLMGTGRRIVERHLAELKRRGRIRSRTIGRGWVILPAPEAPNRPDKGDPSASPKQTGQETKATAPNRPDKSANQGGPKQTGGEAPNRPDKSEAPNRPDEVRVDDTERRVARATQTDAKPDQPVPAERPPSTPSFYDRMVDELGIWPPTADAIAGEWALSPQYLGNRAKVRDPIDFLRDTDKRQRVLDGAYRDKKFADRPKPVPRCRVTVLPDQQIISADRPTWLRLILTGRLSRDEFDRCRSIGWGRDEDWQRNLFVRREAERVAREQRAAERAEAEAQGDAPWLMR